MKASIQISKHSIKVIAYTQAGSSISVKAYHTHPLPEECVMNGVILEPAPVIEGLKSLKSKYPQSFTDVSLVLDGSFVYSKRISVPNKLKSRMYYGVIRDEFAEVSSDVEHLICTYFPLTVNEDGSKQILACGVENTHAQTYLSIFREAGIKLSSVHLGIQALLRFISSKPELSKLPFVLSVIDDVIMLSMIFQKGVNMFQSRSRLYGEDRATLVRSTLDSLSGIVQFNKSQNFDDLTHYFYIGLSDSDMDLVSAGGAYPDIRFGLLDIFKGMKGAEMLPPDAHFAFLNALVPDSEPDLFFSIKQSEKLRKLEKPRNIMLPIAIGVAVLVISVLIYTWIQTTLVERENRDLLNYINDPFIVSETNEINSLLADTEYIIGLYSAVDAKSKELAAKPQVSRQLIELIVRTGRQNVIVIGLNFNSNNGIISVSAIGTNEHNAAAYVEELRSHSMIETVYYAGYTVSGTDEFFFNIEIVQTGWREEVPVE
jgi:hypothetical protein